MRTHTHKKTCMHVHACAHTHTHTKHACTHTRAHAHTHNTHTHTHNHTNTLRAYRHIQVYTKIQPEDQQSTYDTKPHTHTHTHVVSTTHLEVAERKGWGVWGRHLFSFRFGMGRSSMAFGCTRLICATGSKTTGWTMWQEDTHKPAECQGEPDALTVAVGEHDRPGAAAPFPWWRPGGGATLAVHGEGKCDQQPGRVPMATPGLLLWGPEWTLWETEREKNQSMFYFMSVHSKVILDQNNKQTNKTKI